MSDVYGLRLLADPRVARRAIIVLLSLALVVRAAYFLAFTTQIQWGYDFSAYWQAAGHVLDGQPVYSPHQLAGPYAPQLQGLYLYPPFFAVAMTPFAAAFDDYRVANWAWAALGATLAVVAVLLVAQRERIGVGRERLLLVGAAFAFPAVVGELALGNVHLLLLGLIGIAWWALGRADAGRHRWSLVAGILVGVATLIKIFPAMLILWFLLRRRWSAAVASVVTMGVLMLATLPLVGFGSWLDYPTVLLNLGPPADPSETLAPVVWLSDVVPVVVARLVVGVTGLTIVAWSARHLDESVSFAIAVSVSVLIAPALYHHYLALLILPLLIALRRGVPLWWVAAAYLLMWGGDQDALGGFEWILRRALPIAGAVLLLVGLLMGTSAASRAPVTADAR